MWPATIEGEEEFFMPNFLVDQLLPLPDLAAAAAAAIWFISRSSFGVVFLIMICRSSEEVFRKRCSAACRFWFRLVWS